MYYYNLQELEDKHFIAIPNSMTFQSVAAAKNRCNSNENYHSHKDFYIENYKSSVSIKSSLIV